MQLPDDQGLLHNQFSNDDTGQTDEECKPQIIEEHPLQTVSTLDTSTMPARLSKKNMSHN